jgi:hypothetical protein
MPCNKHMRMNIYAGTELFECGDVGHSISATSAPTRSKYFMFNQRNHTRWSFLQSNMDKIFDPVKNHDPFTKFFHDASGSKEVISQDLTEESNQQKIAEKRQKKQLLPMICYLSGITELLLIRLR